MRLERDFLGTREVPAEAYYGIQSLRAQENFPISGYRLDPLYIRSLGVVKQAAALANAAVGDLQPRLAEAIAEAAAEVAAGQWQEQFIVDPIQGGAGTSANMNANEVIANRALELLGDTKGNYQLVSPNNHVNMAQSTNDAVPTAIRLTALQLIPELQGALQELQSTLLAKGQSFDGIVKMGRTHLQDAVPIRLGQEFTAWATAIGREQQRLQRAQEGLVEVNMGATAVGTGLNARPSYQQEVVTTLARLTGLPLRPPANLVDATQHVDGLVEVSAALRSMALTLTKIANDLRLMASGPRAGLGELNLPPMQPGSSIMPGKVNPVIPEVVNQVCFKVIGNDTTIALAAQAGQFELNVMEPVLAFSLFESLRLMRQAIVVFVNRCLIDVTANSAHCQAQVENSASLITALSPHLGYERASELARECLATGKAVRTLCLEQGLFSEEELSVILSPHELTQPGVAGAALKK